jgi:hypothetical protein
MTVFAVCLFRLACHLHSGSRPYPLPHTSLIAGRARPVDASHPFSCCLVLHLNTIICECLVAFVFPNQTATAPNKLTARSSACVLLGYPSDHRGYRCFDLATRRVITSRHVTFDERQFPFHHVQSATVHHPTTEVVVFQQPISN